MARRSCPRHSPTSSSPPSAGRSATSLVSWRFGLAAAIDRRRLRARRSTAGLHTTGSRLGQSSSPAAVLSPSARALAALLVPAGGVAGHEPGRSAPRRIPVAMRNMYEDHLMAHFVRGPSRATWSRSNGDQAVDFTPALDQDLSSSPLLPVGRARSARAMRHGLPGALLYQSAGSRWRWSTPPSSPGARGCPAPGSRSCSGSCPRADQRGRHGRLHPSPCCPIRSLPCARQRARRVAAPPPQLRVGGWVALRSAALPSSRAVAAQDGGALLGRDRERLETLLHARDAADLVRIVAAGEHVVGAGEGDRQRERSGIEVDRVVVEALEVFARRSRRCASGTPRTPRTRGRDARPGTGIVPPRCDSTQRMRGTARRRR